MNSLNKLLIAATAVSAEQFVCSKQVELFYVFDASSSYDTFFRSMSNEAPELSARVSEIFEDSVVKMRATFFVDKPLPHAGLSEGRGWPYDYDLDFCYSAYPVTQSVDSFASNLVEAQDYLTGSGGDFPENPYEGLALTILDPSGYTPASVQYVDDRVVTRVAVLVTDDFGKLAGAARQGVEDWNADPEHPDRVVFYHPDFYSTASGRFQQWFTVEGHDSPSAYRKLVEFHERELQGDELSLEEQELQKTLYHFVGPDTFPVPKPWEPSFDMASAENCSGYDYPSLEQVGSIVRDNKVVPIVVVSPVRLALSAPQKSLYQQNCDNSNANPTIEEYQQCVIKTFERELSLAGIDRFLVTGFDQNDLESFKSAVVSAVEEMSGGKYCGEDDLTTTTTTEQVEQSTTTTLATSADEPTSATSDLQASTSDVTSDIESTHDSVKTSSEIVESSDSINLIVSSSDDKTESEAGAPIGVIAGAAAGGAVALGLAAFAAKSFGLFGKAVADPVFNADVEMQHGEAPLDREAAEGVTMEMFA